MLTDIKIGFIGGDARQTEVIRFVLEQDATVVMIGYDRPPITQSDIVQAPLSAESFRDLDALVLPVAGIADDGKVTSSFNDTEIVMTEEHFAAMPRYAKVFSGIARQTLEKWCSTHNLRLIKLMELDEVAILNSIPTAEGAIQMAMNNTDITIHNSKIMVLGFGRSGMTIARMCHALGAKVKVGTRKSEDMARIFEMGFQPFSLMHLSDEIRDQEIVFNTIPAHVLTAEIIAKLPKQSVIIDIASIPGGTDFRFAEKRGVKAILAPSLPGIVAPKTAGQIIAKTLYRLMTQHD